MITEERRESGVDRVPVRRPVAICAGRQGTLVQGETVDLSPRGMQVSVDGTLRPGEHLVFRLDLGPEFSTVVEGGEVAWVLPSGPTTTAGVRFVPLPRRPAGKLDPAPAPEAPKFSPGEELRVKVGGMTQALRAEFIDQEGPGLLRFRCPLPFLKLRSPVVVHSAQGTEAVFEGEVGAVEVSTVGEGGVPNLVVTVWNGAGEGEEGFVVVGALESAGVPVSCARSASSRERATVPDPAGSAAPLPRDTVEIEPVVEPSPATAPAGATEGGVGGERVATPVPEGSAPETDGVPVDPVDLGRRAGAAVSEAGRRSVTAVVGSARGAAGRLWPVLRSFFILTFGGLRRAARWVAGLVSGAYRRWRRSRLPQTYSDVVRRGAQHSGGAAGSKRVHRIALAMGLLGVGLAVWGLFGAASADGRSAAKPPAVAAETSAGAVGSENASSWVPDVPSAWPSAGELPSGEDGGAVAAAQDWGAAPAVEAPAPEAAPAAPAVGEERPAAADHAPSGGSGSARAAAAPAVSERGKRFTIKLDGPPLRIRDYALRQPPGIVVDVMGAGPETPGVAIETGSNAVKLVKASPRDEGTRFIIYLRARAMPRYTIDPDGNGFAVTLLD